MPPCLAHDLFEGIVQYDLYLALAYFEKVYKLKKEIINRKIDNFAFLLIEKLDKPSRVPIKGYNIGGHAVQNWVFLRFIPLIIGDKINRKDDVWKMITILIQVVGIICSPSICNELLFHLDSLIKKYLSIRVKCFEVTLRPKHHYLEHYPQLIQVFGPLICVNTLSFEHKHVFYKNFVRTSRNFKNVTKSISTKHQYYQSALTKNEMFYNSPVIQSANTLEEFTYDNNIMKCLVSIFSVDELNSLHFGTEVIYRGTQYCEDQCIVIGSKTNLDICKLKLFCIKSKKVYAIGIQCDGIIDDDFQIYVLSVSDNYIIIITLSNLNDYTSYSINTHKDRPVIVLKHIINL
ncbi:unnamed protein product [Macrosiphum euphorbiae]|uniref:Uncharacterized protein n=1 Tax=Macrosiphum euphorbiae TaxID=13131 RepID=A0AAV0WM43_9HEMI|nr:unnamed protein product [Macrosiphum euphorbiae]